MKWLDNNKTEVDTNRTDLPSVMYADIVNIKVCIHKMLGCGGELYLSCQELNINDWTLDTDNFDDAVLNAQKIIGDEFERLEQAVNEFLEIG